MKYNRYIKAWLIAGCILLFFQIIIGGITRITGSGLSITKWEIVTGTLPPLSDSAWEVEFDLYKETPQYQKINDGMLMQDFKFIYFWEYFHRLWARLMAFSFLIPLIFFVIKKWIDRRLIKRMAYVFFSAMLAAIFGWIMVASGLIERPWVNAYKLSLHLSIALLTMAFLLWATFSVFFEETAVENRRIYKWAMYFFIAIAIQIFLGAILSGMRAALYYPTWPTLNGAWVPEVLTDSSSWSLSNIVDYDKDALMPALIHVLHRNWGYLVYGLGMIFGIKILRYPMRRLFYVVALLLIVCLNLQVLLGILVLVNSKATIPVSFGVLHQAVAIIIFGVGLMLIYLTKQRRVHEREH